MPARYSPATAETLARMAQTLSIPPAELAAAGRQDAADILLASQQHQSLGRRLAQVPGLGDLRWLPEPTANASELLPAIAAALDQIESADLPNPAKHDLTTMLVANLTHDIARRHHELLIILRLATGHPAAKQHPTS